MKTSNGTLTPMFNTHRMVQEYMESFYLKADTCSRVMAENGYQRSVELAAWREKVKTGWKSLSIKKVDANTANEYTVGSEMLVNASVQLGSLVPEDVSVEVYYGPIDQRREIIGASSVVMKHMDTDKDGLHIYQGSVTCAHSGQHGFTVRVLPSHPDMVHPYELRLILWQ